MNISIMIFLMEVFIIHSFSEDYSIFTNISHTMMHKNFKKKCSYLFLLLSFFKWLHRILLRILFNFSLYKMSQNMLDVCEQFTAKHIKLSFMKIWQTHNEVLVILCNMKKRSAPKTTTNNIIKILIILWNTEHITTKCTNLIW